VRGVLRLLAQAGVELAGLFVVLVRARPEPVGFCHPLAGLTFSLGNALFCLRALAPRCCRLLLRGCALGLGAGGVML
jgi:hypothetical protein